MSGDLRWIFEWRLPFRSSSDSEDETEVSRPASPEVHLDMLGARS